MSVDLQRRQQMPWELINGSAQVCVPTTQVQCNYTCVQADVVFCSTVKNLDLSCGIISKNISTAAGTRLQQDCLTTYPTGVNYGQVVKMPAYNLTMAKNIYLGACYRWDGGKSGQSESVRLYILCWSFFIDLQKFMAKGVDKGRGLVGVEALPQNDKRGRRPAGDDRYAILS